MVSIPCVEGKRIYVGVCPQPKGMGPDSQCVCPTASGEGQAVAQPFE